MSQVDPKLVEELKAKHGNDLIGINTADGTLLVFRKPRRQEYDRWFDERSQSPSQAGRALALSCIAHPSSEELTAALDAYPALLMCEGGIVGSLAELAGADRGSDKAKKL